MTAFWRFWAATSVSAIGSGITTVALPLTALYALDATAVEVGFITAAGYVGWATLGLLAGVICQLLPLRGLQVATDLIRAVAIASVPVAYGFDALSIVHLVVVNLVISYASVLFDVSNSTFLPAVVEPDELNNRNSWMSGMYSTTQVGAPSVAGLLVQLLGPAWTLLVDAVSYLASAVILQSLPARSQPRVADRPSYLAMIVEGWRFVIGRPVTRACLWDATASNFVSGALMTLIPVYLVETMDASAVVIGVLLAAEGVGGLLGAVVVTRLSDRWGTAQAALYGSVLSSLLVLLLPVGLGVPGLVLFGVGTIGFAAGAIVTSINTRTYRQLTTPPELLSRVMATVRFVSWGVVPVGSLLGGVAAVTLGNRPALLLFCLLTFVSPAVLFFSPVRTLRDLTDDTSPTVEPAR